MEKPSSHSVLTIFLCGDIMTGRGIDQILPHPSDPRLHEPYVRDARSYVELAEKRHGAIPRPAGFRYVWGETLAILDREAPQARVVNLETSVTASDDYWLGKGINYRMHPANVPVLTAAGIDVVALANNHVLDWGYEGLAETLLTLKRSAFRVTGAGNSLAEAESPAVVEVGGLVRLLVFSFGLETSGIPPVWGATRERPGVNLLPDLSDGTVRRVAELVGRARKPRDITVFSVHWGGNWGYGVSREERAFAHRLVDEAGIDIVHGHSSHHAKGIEVYDGKLILYGCGDFINDYEGIGGYEEFRGDISVMYFVRMDAASGRLVGLRMMPLQMRRFQLHRATLRDARWLEGTLTNEGRRFGTRVESAADGALLLRW